MISTGRRCPHGLVNLGKAGGPGAHKPYGGASTGRVLQTNEHRIPNELDRELWRCVSVTLRDVGARDIRNRCSVSRLEYCISSLRQGNSLGGHSASQVASLGINHCTTRRSTSDLHMKEAATTSIACPISGQCSTTSPKHTSSATTWVHDWPVRRCSLALDKECWKRR